MMVIINQGSVFMSKEFQKYLDTQGIHHHLTPTCLPQGNGYLERMARALKVILYKSIGDKPNSTRDEPLNSIIYAYNSSQQEIIGETTFFQIHGFQPSISGMKLSDMAFALPTIQKVLTEDEEIESMVRVGYLIMVKDRHPKRKAVKLYPPYKGLYMVTKVEGQNVHCLPLYRFPTIKVHVTGNHNTLILDISDADGSSESNTELPCAGLPGRLAHDVKSSLKTESTMVEWSLITSPMNISSFQHFP